MWKEFLSVFVENVLLAFAPVLASLLVAWVLAKVKAAWAEFEDEQAGSAWMLKEIAIIAVKAAEQMKLAGLIEEKKDYAVQTATAWLEAHGYKINLAVIDAAIEAAVLEHFPKTE
jgi:hypothetical protein